MWSDKLTSYNGQTISYDSIGNPTSYRGATLTWNGRLLTSYEKDGVKYTYTYNESGLRTSKTKYDGNVKKFEETYIWSGDKLAATKKTETANGLTAVISYLYDSNDEVYGFTYNNKTYIYVKTIQGDVGGIINATDNIACIGIFYDAWGNVTYDYNEELDSLGMLEAMNIASINSIAYRGYFYDYETGLYYLQSRYYDPETGRFINADDTAYIGYDSSPISTNIFAYCANNPVNKVDYGGYSGKYIFEESIPLFEPKREKDDYVFINRKKTPYYKALKNLAYTGSSVLSRKYPNGVKFYKRCLDGEGQMFMYNYMEAYNQDSQIKETIIKHFFEMKKYVIKYYGTKSNYSICRDNYFMVDCSTMDWKFALNSHWANIGAQIFYDSKAKEYTAKVAVLAIDLYNFSKTKAFKITDNAIINKGVKFAIKNTGIFIEMGLAHDYYSYGMVTFKLKWKNDNRITVFYC